MENFLLILDEIDDAVAALRMLLPQLLGFAAACGLFGLSVVAVMHWPVLATLALAVIGIIALLPSRHLKPLLGLKSDP